MGYGARRQRDGLRLRGRDDDQRVESFLHESRSRDGQHDAPFQRDESRGEQAGHGRGAHAEYQRGGQRRDALRHIDRHGGDNGGRNQLHGRKQDTLRRGPHGLERNDGHADGLDADGGRRGGHGGKQFLTEYRCRLVQGYPDGNERVFHQRPDCQSNPIQGRRAKLRHRQRRHIDRLRIEGRQSVG